MSPARLIALDWGTTNLRASLLDAAGRALDARSAAVGVLAVPEGGFQQALRSLCGDWIDGLGLPVMASGMVGSRQGWREAPYLNCPADLQAAARRCVRIELAGSRSVLYIAPGLQCTDAAGQTDVMRGEETQIWGADAPPGSCCLLPGTHSKWAWLGEGGTIARFATYMTGELYALLTQHGILGRLMQFGVSSPDDLAAGVRLGLQGGPGLSHTLFAARTAGLTGRVPPQGLPDFLSGILIGAELGAATADWSAAARRQGVTLIGDAALCQRYEWALRLQGIASHRASDTATVAGQWRLATALGLVG